MNPPLTLVQLVSARALPNLLPILAFAPDVVVQIRSSDPRLKHTAKALREAARSAGFDNKITDKLIPHPSPGADHTAEVVGSLAERHEEGPLLVNLAGGDTLMAIGAFRAVGPDHTCFCCDRESGGIIHLSGPPLPAHRPFAAASSGMRERSGRWRSRSMTGGCSPAVRRHRETLGSSWAERSAPREYHLPVLLGSVRNTYRILIGSDP